MDFINNIQIIHNPSGLITVNETLIFQLISFLMFLFIINRIMFRPLRDTMEKRENHIETIKRDIQNAENELKNVTSLIEKSEIAVKEEALAMRVKIEEAGKAEASNSLETTRNDISEMKEKAEKEINSQIESAREQIKNEFQALGNHIIEKILERRMAS
jgi:F-type H+-transporting ATPase subunit b